MKALIIGATGLVGKEFLKRTLEDPQFTSVVVFVRRSTGISHSKLSEKIVNFDELSNWKGDLQGDVLFSAMGTTIKVAGTKEAFYRVDFEYPWKVALAALNNGVKKIVLVSSTGADANSRFFYLKTKGELEEAVKKLGFETVVILRPSILEGEREVSRSGEKIAQFFLNKIPKSKKLARILPVAGKKVALKGIEIAQSKVTGTVTLEAQDILF